MKIVVTMATALLAIGSESAISSDAARSLLRVCADPNNLPFSNDRGEGFENKIAELIAKALDRELAYTWWAQRRGFIRNTLQAGECDLVMGIPAESELALTTRPYYRSSYVFVTRRDLDPVIASLDDDRLRRLRIGVHTIGDDFSNVPPAHALSERGIIQNVRGYSIFGDYSQPDPPRRLIEALANGEIDVAIAWGPLAGYFSKKSNVALQLVPVSPSRSSVFPMVFDIAMGVRREDVQFKGQIEDILSREKSTVQEILTSYGVPQMPLQRNTEPRR